MCGIIWHKKDTEKANKGIFKQYEKQKTRGTQGFGFVVVSKGMIKDIKRAQFEKDMLPVLKEAKEYDEILFHHRFPTSTPNTLGATHPIYVHNDKLKFDYIGVHNGVISNPTERRTEHEKQGFTYTTIVETQYSDSYGVYPTQEKKFNDSEALIIDIALALESDAPRVESRGSAAFIIYQLDKETGKIENLFCGRNYSNPLKFNTASGSVTLSSEGEGKEVEPYKLFKFNYKKNELEFVRNFDIFSSYYQGTTWDKDQGAWNKGKNNCGFKTSKETDEDFDDVPKGAVTGILQGRVTRFETLDDLDEAYLSCKDAISEYEKMFQEAVLSNDRKEEKECLDTLIIMRKRLKDFDKIYDRVYGITSGSKSGEPIV